MEFRIAETHIGKGLIETPNVKVQEVNPYWSYFRHLSYNWDFKKVLERTDVARQLLANLETTAGDEEMDLSPLLKDQRASGFIYGSNPIQNMYDLVVAYAENNPEHEFYGKWGGYMPELPGKRFIFYAENTNDANRIISGVRDTADVLNIRIEINHQYGLTDYQKYAKIDNNLKSEINDKDGFKALLTRLTGFPHFFHQFFFSDRLLAKYR